MRGLGEVGDRLGVQCHYLPVKMTVELRSSAASLSLL